MVTEGDGRGRGDWQHNSEVGHVGAATIAEAPCEARPAENAWAGTWGES